MDVTEVGEHLLRRWRLVLVVIAVAVLGGALAHARAGSLYESSATVVIAPPTLDEGVVGQNPMLNLDDNLSQLAVVLAAATTGGPDESEEGEEVTWTVSTVTGTNPSFARLSPQLVFDVTATTPDGAERTAAALVERAGERLAELQEEVGASASTRASLATVVPATRATPSGGGGLRAAGAVGLGLLALGLLGVLLLDTLAQRHVRLPAGPQPRVRRWSSSYRSWVREQRRLVRGHGRR